MRIIFIMIPIFPGVGRGTEQPDDFGGGHAHVGMAIYQADHFPVEWRNRLLTWNQHGRRLNRERLKREGVDMSVSMRRMCLRIPMNGFVEWK